MTTTLAATATLALGFGRSRDVVAVADYADASRIYRAAVLKHEVETQSGSSTMPNGCVYEVCGASVRRIAVVSYNGRVWSANEDPVHAKPLYDPYAATGGAA